MFSPIPDVPAVVVSEGRQQAFLALLPRIEAHARATFAAVRCPHDRADAVADSVAVAWERFRFQRGGRPHPDRLAAWAVDAVRTARSRSRPASEPTA